MYPRYSNKLGIEKDNPFISRIEFFPTNINPQLLNPSPILLREGF